MTAPWLNGTSKSYEKILHVYDVNKISNIFFKSMGRFLNTYTLKLQTSWNGFVMDFSSCQSLVLHILTLLSSALNKKRHIK